MSRTGMTRTLQSADRIILDSFDDQWILSGLNELRRRALGEGDPDWNAFDALCGWLEEAAGSASVVAASGLGSALSAETAFDGETLLARAEELGRLLAFDTVEFFLEPEDAQLVYRVLKRFGEERGLKV